MYRFFYWFNILLRIERYTKHNNVNLKVIDYKPTGSVSGVLGQFLAVDAYQVKKLDENKGQLLWVSQSFSSILRKHFFMLKPLHGEVFT